MAKPISVGKQVARELLGQRAAARRLSGGDEIAHQRKHHARDAQPGVIEEVAVFGRDDRVAQVLGNLLVGDDDAPLDGEVAGDGPVAVEHARDGVGRVVVQRRDERQIVGVGEHDAAQRAEERRDHEERGDAGVARDLDGVSHISGCAQNLCGWSPPGAAAA